MDLLGRFKGDANNNESNGVAIGQFKKNYFGKFNEDGRNALSNDQLKNRFKGYLGNDE